MFHQNKQNVQHSPPPDKDKKSHYRVAGSSFWRGFFLGFFPSIYGEYNSKVRRYPSNPFLEDQKRIGADMYNAIGLTIEDAKESERASS